MSRFPSMTNQWIDQRQEMFELRDQINNHLDMNGMVTVISNNRRYRLGRGMYAAKVSNRVVNIHDRATGKRLYRLYRPKLQGCKLYRENLRADVPNIGDRVAVTADVAWLMYINTEGAGRMGYGNCLRPQPLPEEVLVRSVKASINGLDLELFHDDRVWNIFVLPYGINILE